MSKIRKFNDDLGISDIPKAKNLDSDSIAEMNNIINNLEFLSRINKRCVDYD